MLKETLKEKKEGYLKGYLTRIIRKNDAPPGKVPDSLSFDTFSLRLVSKSYRKSKRGLIKSVGYKTRGY